MTWRGCAMNSRTLEHVLEETLTPVTLYWCPQCGGINEEFSIYAVNGVDHTACSECDIELPFNEFKEIDAIEHSFSYECPECGNQVSDTQENLDNGRVICPKCHWDVGPSLMDHRKYTAREKHSQSEYLLWKHRQKQDYKGRAA